MICSCHTYWKLAVTQAQMSGRFWHHPSCDLWESWPIASSGISAVIVEFVWVWEGTGRQSFKSVEEIWNEMINSTYWYCFSPPFHYKPWNPQWCNWHCRFVRDLKLVLDGLLVIVSWDCDDLIFLELLSYVFKCWVLKYFGRSCAAFLVLRQKFIKPVDRSKSLGIYYCAEQH
jgi:hypothetical protein